LSPLTPQVILTQLGKCLLALEFQGQRPGPLDGPHLPRESVVTKRIVSIFLPLAAICLLSGCKSDSAEQASPAPAPAAQPVADAAPPEEIPPVDPIWDAIAKKQAHLDQVEKIRTGKYDAISCQKAVAGFQRRLKIDTSACNPLRLRAEREAEHAQLFDRMVKTLHHEN